ncbi:MAG: chemotaxis protein CheW [Syntrophomonadaceae bacterium]|jgi:purine-binding chemotaxis protein CheW|nr:chemotaxis protein CheW [Syntrophomonadaceae bacterium]
MDEINQLVVFTLNIEYAIPVSKMQEIITLPPVITPLPEAPEYIVGLMNLRGAAIPIVDLNLKFKTHSVPDILYSYCILIKLPEQTIGILVENVSELLKLPADSIKPTPPVVTGIAAQYLSGIGLIGPRIIYLLDVEKIFTEGDKNILRELTEK